jgi:hypothetical protein
MRLPSELGAALPHLRHLTVAGYRNGGHGLEGLLSCRGLRSLALVGVYCSALPGLGPLSRLGRLEVASAFNLRELPCDMPAALQARRPLRCRDAPFRWMHARPANAPTLSGWWSGLAMQAAIHMCAWS